MRAFNRDVLGEVLSFLTKDDAVKALNAIIERKRRVEKVVPGWPVEDISGVVVANPHLTPFISKLMMSELLPEEIDRASSMLSKWGNRAFEKLTELMDIYSTFCAHYVTADNFCLIFSWKPSYNNRINLPCSPHIPDKIHLNLQYHKLDTVASVLREYIRNHIVFDGIVTTSTRHADIPEHIFEFHEKGIFEHKDESGLELVGRYQRKSEETRIISSFDIVANKDTISYIHHDDRHYRQVDRVLDTASTMGSMSFKGREFVKWSDVLVGWDDDEEVESGKEGVVLKAVNKVKERIVYAVHKDIIHMMGSSLLVDKCVFDSKSKDGKYNIVDGGDAIRGSVFRSYVNERFGYKPLVVGPFNRKWQFAYEGVCSSHSCLKLFDGILHLFGYSDSDGYCKVGGGLMMNFTHMFCKMLLDCHPVTQIEYKLYMRNIKVIKELFNMHVYGGEKVSVVDLTAMQFPRSKLFLDTMANMMSLLPNKKTSKIIRLLETCVENEYYDMLAKRGQFEDFDRVMQERNLGMMFAGLRRSEVMSVDRWLVLNGVDRIRTDNIGKCLLCWMFVQNWSIDNDLLSYMLKEKSDRIMDVFDWVAEKVECVALCDTYVRRIPKYISLQERIGYLTSNKLTDNFVRRRPDRLWVQDVTSADYFWNRELYLDFVSAIFKLIECECGYEDLFKLKPPNAVGGVFWITSNIKFFNVPSIMDMFAMKSVTPNTFSLGSANGAIRYTSSPLPPIFYVSDEFGCKYKMENVNTAYFYTDMTIVLRWVAPYYGIRRPIDIITGSGMVGTNKTSTIVDDKIEMTGFTPSYSSIMLPDVMYNCTIDDDIAEVFAEHDIVGIHPSYFICWAKWAIKKGVFKWLDVGPAHCRSIVGLAGNQSKLKILSDIVGITDVLKYLYKNSETSELTTIYQSLKKLKKPFIFTSTVCKIIEEILNEKVGGKVGGESDKMVLPFSKSKVKNYRFLCTIYRGNLIRDLLSNIQRFGFSVGEDCEMDVDLWSLKDTKRSVGRSFDWTSFRKEGIYNDPFATDISRKESSVSMKRFVIGEHRAKVIHMKRYMALIQLGLRYMKGKITGEYMAMCASKLKKIGFKELFNKPVCFMNVVRVTKDSSIELKFAYLFWIDLHYYIMVFGKRSSNGLKEIKECEDGIGSYYKFRGMDRFDDYGKLLFDESEWKSVPALYGSEWI